MTIIIHNHYYSSDQTQKIMATIDEIKAEVLNLKAEVVSLQGSVDTKQAQLAIVLTAGQKAIDALTAQIERLQNGLSPATEADLATILADLKAVHADVDAVQADVDSTPTEAAVEPVTPVDENTAPPVDENTAPIEPVIPAE